MKLAETISKRQYVIATLLVFASAIFFSGKAVLVKLAYQYDVDSISLMALRMICALPFFLIGVAISNRKNAMGKTIEKKDWMYIILFGMFGFYAASLFDFIGLQYITASLERIVLFVYPTLVLLISAIFLKKKITKIQLIALILTYLGIGIAFLENLSLNTGEHQFFGASMVFLAALAYAIFIIGSGNLSPKYGSLRYNSLAMSAACIAIIIHHAFAYQLDLFHFPTTVYWYALLMGIFCTVIPSFMLVEGIRIVGSNNAAIIGSIGPISTIGMAYAFLGETLGIWQWIGTFLVIGGVLLITFRKA